jgi:peptidoglycan/xylan/chitin deacetylase (PgdA/CDA1 family)
MTGALLSAGTAALTAGVLAHGIFYQNSPLFGRAISRGSRHSRDLYLTFDDGPSPTATGQVLEILELHRVPAAFFLVGNNVTRNPELARLIGNTSHEVGNHTVDHRKLAFQGARSVLRELYQAHQMIANATGHTSRIFRAPHGFRNPYVGCAARQLKYTVFGWTFGVWDSARPGADEIRRRTRDKLKPGAIILLHDGDGSDPAGDRSQTAKALSGIIVDAQDAGYSFKPVSDLLPP